MKKTICLLLCLCFALCAVTAQAVTGVWTETGDEEGEGPAAVEYYCDEGILSVFSTILIDMPASFAVKPGEMYAGRDGSLLYAGAVYGDEENGTFDFVLVTETEEGPEAETVLSVIYSPDRIALLEMDDGMNLWTNEAGYYLAAVGDDGSMPKEEAAALLTGLFKDYRMDELLFTDYDAPEDALLDLRVNVPETPVVPTGAIETGTIVTGVTPASFPGSRLVMVNFFESWCGPCMSEMAELERLYETYKDKGFQLLGVFTTPGDTKNIEAVIEEYGLTYPVLDGSDGALYAYMTDYVPTTVLFDGAGNAIENETYIGAADYATWEARILPYLG